MPAEKLEMELGRVVETMEKCMGSEVGAFREVRCNYDSIVSNLTVGDDA